MELYLGLFRLKDVELKVYAYLELTKRHWRQRTDSKICNNCQIDPGVSEE